MLVRILALMQQAEQPSFLLFTHMRAMLWPADRVCGQPTKGGCLTRVGCSAPKWMGCGLVLDLGSIVLALCISCRMHVNGLENCYASGHACLHQPVQCLLAVCVASMEHTEC